MLKLIHDKFKAKNAKNDDLRRSFHKTFDAAVANAAELKPHIGKAHEDLNPLIIYELFQKINSEVRSSAGF